VPQLNLSKLDTELNNKNNEGSAKEVISDVNQLKKARNKNLRTAGQSKSSFRKAQTDVKDAKLKMGRSFFLSTGRSAAESIPDAHRRSNPLQLTSKKASLSKIEKAGFKIDDGFANLVGSESGKGSSKDALAKYLQMEYGELIPKVNLTSLPEFKVTEFIRILNQYHTKMKS